MVINMVNCYYLDRCLSIGLRWGNERPSLSVLRIAAAVTANCLPKAWGTQTGCHGHQTVALIANHNSEVEAVGYSAIQPTSPHHPQLFITHPPPPLLCQRLNPIPECKLTPLCSFLEWPLALFPFLPPNCDFFCFSTSNDAHLTLC